MHKILRMKATRNIQLYLLSVDMFMVAANLPARPFTTGYGGGCMPCMHGHRQRKTRALILVRPIRCTCSKPAGRPSTASASRRLRQLCPTDRCDDVRTTHQNDATLHRRPVTLTLLRCYVHSTRCSWLARRISMPTDLLNI